MIKKNNSELKIARNLGIKQNVCIRVIDEISGKVIQEHVGHNAATNSMLFGIAHHLVGDFIPNETHGLNPGFPTLSNFVPRYISLGTMGLINQKQDSHGLPAGLGDSIPDSSDPEYQNLLEQLRIAKAALDDAEAALEDECPYYPATSACESCTQCSERIEAKKQAVEEAKSAYDYAYDAVLSYNEEARLTEYISRRPGYGADGYDPYENNGRKYEGLGYAYTSYDTNYKYVVGDVTTFNGKLYECIQETLYPCGPFNPSYWRARTDALQPSLGTTINLELISPSFPRQDISYRDIGPE